MGKNWRKVRPKDTDRKIGCTACRPLGKPNSYGKGCAQCAGRGWVYTISIEELWAREAELDT